MWPKHFVTCHGCFPTRGRPYRSQEVFSSTESDEGEEEDDSGEDNEGEEEHEVEDEDDEVFVPPPPPPRSKQQRARPKRNGEISPPLSASPAAPTTVFGKNSAANHGVKMVEGVGGDVADVLEVGTRTEFCSF